MIEFDQETCRDFEKSSKLEWLETNGIGGFASGTVSGANTRRYHGLLVAATNPPVGRAVLLSKFEETLNLEGKIYEISANAYPQTIYPQGYEFIRSFAQNPFPTWTYDFGEFVLEKCVFMPHGVNATIIEYKLRLPAKRDLASGTLELKPLIAFRDYHRLGKERNFRTGILKSANSVVIKPTDDLPALHFNFENLETIEKTALWYRNFEYEIERERGFDFQEDLFQPFALKFDLTKGGSKVSICVSTETEESRETIPNKQDIANPQTVFAAGKNFRHNAQLKEDEQKRRENIVRKANFDRDFLKLLAEDADQYIVKRGAGKTIIAGYHWFSDWGRDTMIALPGLTLTTNRPEIAKEILLEFSRHISQGMIPNRFPDAGETPEYNTVDATLWYFEAIRAYLEKTKDYNFVEEFLYEKLTEIIVWHLKGTRYQIHVDTDGLLYAGEDGVQLTWMDAKIGDLVITPRIGKPVEIQALWYNALRIMEHLAAKFGDDSGKFQYASMADLAQLSFNQKFWNAEKECLFDVIKGEMRDASVRPNQIFAVSLKNAILSPEKAQKVVRKVEEELLTPVGLRSLSPKDAAYCGRYEGSPFKRDSSYHQGTVWAWLFGAFLTAYAKAFADETDTQEKLENWLEGIKAHFSEAGIGQISEIFDGDAPHTPRGCIAQAWSVGELLRASVEDVYRI